MDALRGWIIGLCFAAVAGAVLEMLSPNGAMRKPVRILIALFLLSALLLPAANSQKWQSIFAEIQANAARQTTFSVAETGEAHLLSAFRQAVATTVRERLAAVGVVPKSLSVEASIQAETVSLDRICLTVQATEKAQTTAILRALGAPYELQTVEASGKENA